MESTQQISFIQARVNSACELHSKYAPLKHIKQRYLLHQLMKILSQTLAHEKLSPFPLEAVGEVPVGITWSCFNPADRRVFCSSCEGRAPVRSVCRAPCHHSRRRSLPHLVLVSVLSMFPCVSFHSSNIHSQVSFLP